MLSIEIKIGRKDFVIRADSTNYMLGHFVNNKGKQQFAADAFFSNLPALFNYLINQKIRKSSVRSLEELTVLIKKVEKEIIDVWTSDPIRRFANSSKSEMHNNYLTEKE